MLRILPTPAVRFGENVPAACNRVWEAASVHPTSSVGFIEASAGHAPPGFALGTAVYGNDVRLLAGAAFLRYDFRLDMPLGASFRRLGDWLVRVAPRLVRVPLIALGSPLADRCALTFDADLDREGRHEVFGALLEGFMAEAKATRADVLAIKDLPDDLARDLHPVLATYGYTRIASLPIALLDLPFESEEEYVASLKPSMRADLRRKLRQSDGKVQFVVGAGVRDLGPKLERLYEETRERSKADYGEFDQLSPGFLESLLTSMPGKARLVTCWLGETLAGFNLFFSDRRRAVAFKIGLRGDLARSHNLYFLNWMWMVRHCIAERIPLLEMGQTTYELKTRLGCRLEPSWIYVRHRTAGWNSLFKLFGPHVSFAGMDPDLRRMKFDPLAEFAASPGA